jgi:hypothetical protein
MTYAKVIPFPERGPALEKLEACRSMTREWGPSLRQLLLPRHYYWAATAAMPPRCALATVGSASLQELGR